MTLKKRAIRRHHRKRRLAAIERRPFAKILGDKINRQMIDTTIWVRHYEPVKGKWATKPSLWRANITYKEQLALVGGENV